MRSYLPDADGLLECGKCGVRKPLSGFFRDRMWASGYDRRCKACRKLAKKPRTEEERAKNRERNRKRWACDENSYRTKQLSWWRSLEGKRRRMLQCARDRARAKGLPFSITIADVVMPAVCPLLGISIEPGDGKLHANSPSLDRLRPELGYVPGNVIVISYRANAIKQDATPEELERIAAALRKLLG